MHFFVVLVPGILKNKTVIEGDSVTLSCKIQSSDLLFIRKLIHNFKTFMTIALLDGESFDLLQKKAHGTTK